MAFSCVHEIAVSFDGYAEIGKLFTERGPGALAERHRPHVEAVDYPP